MIWTSADTIACAVHVNVLSRDRLHLESVQQHECLWRSSTIRSHFLDTMSNSVSVNGWMCSYRMDIRQSVFLFHIKFSPVKHYARSDSLYLGLSYQGWWVLDHICTFEWFSFLGNISESEYSMIPWNYSWWTHFLISKVFSSSILETVTVTIIAILTKTTDVVDSMVPDFLTHQTFHKCRYFLQNDQFMNWSLV